MTSEAHLSRVSLRILTQDATVDYETSEEYFYDSEQSLASEASEDSFNSANEELFLPYDVRTDVRRFQLISL